MSSDPKDPKLDEEKASLKAWHEYTQKHEEYQGWPTEEWIEHSAEEPNAREINQFLNEGEEDEQE